MPHARHLRKFYGHRWRTVTRPQILTRAALHCERCQKLVINERHLEIAHLYIEPGNPGHDDPDNLAALCHKCHRRHDRNTWSRRCFETRTRRKDGARPLLQLLIEGLNTDDRHNNQNNQ